MASRTATLPQPSEHGRASLVRLAQLVGAAGVLVTGYVHYYLYFEGGYRGIQPANVLGLTISRSFALNAIAAVVIAEGLVGALRWRRLLIPATVAGIGFAAATLVAYVLTRTTGFLGFSDSQAATEAVVAVTAEAIALVVLTAVLVLGRAPRATSRDAGI